MVGNRIRNPGRGDTRAFDSSTFRYAKISPMAVPRRARKGERNYPVLDKYSGVHAAAGVGMALGDAPPWAAFLTTIVWEAVEPQLKARSPEAFPKSTLDTPQNKLGDTIVFMAAYYAARKKFSKKSK